MLAASRVRKSGLPGFAEKLCESKESQTDIRWATNECLLSRRDIPTRGGLHAVPRRRHAASIHFRPDCHWVIIQHFQFRVPRRPLQIALRPLILLRYIPDYKAIIRRASISRGNYTET